MFHEFAGHELIQRLLELTKFLKLEHMGLNFYVLLIRYKTGVLYDVYRNNYNKVIMALFGSRFIKTLKCEFETAFINYILNNILVIKDNLPLTRMSAHLWYQFSSKKSFLCQSLGVNSSHYVTIKLSLLHFIS